MKLTLKTIKLYGGSPMSESLSTTSAKEVDYSKDVFTTGEAHRICCVSQQTIIRCFDNGSLKGFRVPGSTFRRIPKKFLIQFIKDNGMESIMPKEWQTATGVTIVSTEEVNRAVEDLLGKNNVDAHLSGFSLGGALSKGELSPITALDEKVVGADLPDIIQVIQQTSSDVHIVTISGDTSGPEGTTIDGSHSPAEIAQALADLRNGN